MSEVVQPAPAAACNVCQCASLKFAHCVIDERYSQCSSVCNSLMAGTVRVAILAPRQLVGSGELPR